MSGVIRHVTISGRVQGVGYRAWVDEQANARGLEGWVRNRRDGSVEAVFAGPDDVVTEMITACGRGPFSARVAAVHAASGSSDLLNQRRAGERFSVLPTI
ncbi:acylphosphatase [Bradyrhizobium sp. USDA 4524]|uniref:acylphosphatase n=1 Tax=unclassified Bradyrhizobium TaxID=2631580 RepID=UPI00209D9ABD|nr:MULTISPECIES: acylphosphatase [unclassified Bradyrhizobium]MCP1843921.1 acylphosphatase [Bradyrhizobium sp. USDA 4538]MCP1904487.1 acylphosphatase [Bradyrhizobium sp. USDA 4537]MCP1989857.1 acylphosphatase [Bradyrhizobium sp. USDA 4539]